MIKGKCKRPTFNIIPLSRYNSHNIINTFNDVQYVKNYVTGPGWYGSVD